MTYELLPKSQSHIHDEYPQQSATSLPELPPLEFLGEAIFAAGSFWQLDSAFCRSNGEVRTATGYFGGNLKKPTYREVVQGWTGHTEAVRVTYDKRETSYKALCRVFWASHDPTEKEYLEFGIRTHHKSAIFYSNEEEKKQAQQSKVEQQMKLDRRIVTKITHLSSSDSEFYLAESCHQKYDLQKDHMRLCESLSLRSAQQFADSYLACKLNGIISGAKKISIADDLKDFLRTYQLSQETKLVLETMILDLRVEHALQLTNIQEIPKDKKF
ncbi:peptide methionine sulfoxide reductase isoform X1 [Canna indica]|uniref:peptide-methionine (S)-S-oxide reductase n=1 Tax=Canna indica TaxID=4628 RepID=A0AAQ3L3K1_9LILI|nr:peptide methionine sulfoxide reductase isoform X1 [Canna indica]